MFKWNKYILFVIFLSPSLLFAQSKNRINTQLNYANRQYEQKNYQYAIPYYTQYLNSCLCDDTLTIYKLANAYRLIKAYDSALIWYQRFYILRPDNETAAYQYSELLANFKDYDQAITVLNKLVVQKPGIALYKTKLIGYQNRQKMQADSLDWQIRYLSINTPLNEYGPQIRNNGLVFISDRTKSKHDKQFGWSALPFYHFFSTPDTSLIFEKQPLVGYQRTADEINKKLQHPRQSSLDNDKLSPISPASSYLDIKDSSSVWFDINEKSGFNLGPLSFTADGKSMFYTRNKKKKYKNVFGLEIAEATLQNQEWKTVHVLPDTPSVSSFFHPTITSGGDRLYFSSNMAGGFGGNDLYYVDKTSKGWSEPVNLGPGINTSGNEVFPTIKGDTLYFSSDGHKGLGGLDVYRTVKTNTGWSDAENLGYPINSSFDDFGIVWYGNGEKGYFSSNRFGSDDIFSVKRTPQYVDITSKIKLTNQGEIDPAGLQVYLSEKGKGIIDSADVKEDGLIDLKAKKGKEYDVIVKYKGVAVDSSAVNTVAAQQHPEQKKIELKQSTLDPGNIQEIYAKSKGLTYTSRAELIRRKQDSVIMLHQEDSLAMLHHEDSVRNASILQFNVYYKLGGTRISKRYKHYLDSIAVLLIQDTSLHILIASFADCAGSVRINNKITRQRSESAKAYLLSKNVAASKINTEYFGKQYLVKPCKPSGYHVVSQSVNRRSELFLVKDKNTKWLDIHNKYDQLHIDTLGKTIRKQTVAINAPALRRVIKDTAVIVKKADVVAPKVKLKPVIKDTIAVVKRADTIVPKVKLKPVIKDTAAVVKKADTVVQKVKLKPVIKDTVAVVPKAKLKPVVKDTAAIVKKADTVVPKVKLKPVIKDTVAVVKKADTVVPKVKPKPVIKDTAAVVKKADTVVQKAKQKPVVKDTAAVVKKADAAVVKTAPVNNLPKTAVPAKKDSAVKAIATDTAALDQDEVISRKELLAALDSLAKLKHEQERIVDYLTKRINKKPILIYTESDSVFVELYDNGVHDYDSVSVIYNKRLIVDKQELQVNKPIKFTLKVDKDTRKNELVMVAESLGTYPPNTAIMIITDTKHKRQEVILNTDLSTNEVVIFIKMVPK